MKSPSEIQSAIELEQIKKESKDSNARSIEAEKQAESVYIEIETLKPKFIDMLDDLSDAKKIVKALLDYLKLRAVKDGDDWVVVPK